jgi:hypothetical protein
MTVALSGDAFGLQRERAAVFGGSSFAQLEFFSARRRPPDLAETLDRRSPKPRTSTRGGETCGQTHVRGRETRAQLGLFCPSKTPGSRFRKLKRRNNLRYITRLAIEASAGPQPPSSRGC